MPGSSKSKPKSSIEDVFEQQLLEAAGAEDQDEQASAQLLERHYTRQAQLLKARN